MALIDGHAKVLGVDDNLAALLNCPVASALFIDSSTFSPPDSNENDC